MRFLLTGNVGVGKTYVCERIVEKSREAGLNCCGILTLKSEAPEKETRLVVEDLYSRERRIFAHRRTENYRAQPREISFCNFVFLKSGIEFAKRAVSRIGDLLIIDEFGYLEAESRGINNAIPAFQSSENENSILVVRSELRGFVSNLLDCDFEIFEVDQNSRDGNPISIISRILVKMHI